MLLKDSFYTVLASEPTTEGLVAQLKINAAHSIFEGHFPNNPITPGVVQLEIIKELVSDFIGRKVNLQSLSNSKFLAILNPLETPTINVKLSITESEGLIKVSGQIFTTTEVGILKVAAVYH